MRLRLADIERGSVSAEFVMVLPVVVMILGICLGSLALQLERMKLVSVAATISRGLARGEPQEKLAELALGHRLAIENRNDLVCARILTVFSLPGLLGLPFEISDTECARRQGL